MPRIACSAPAAVVFVSLLAMGVTGNAMAQTLNDIARQLPEAVGGFKRAAPPAQHTPATLSDYIDGGAELYLSYNFKGALSQKYKAGQDEIAVDVFDMGTSFDAFGVFAHSRETTGIDVGQGSEYAAGLLTFWKDRFYVSILAYPETPAKKELVFTLGRAIADAIPRGGPLPPVLKLLPPSGLSAESVRYFHHYIWLNSFYFVSNDNVLEIGNDTPAALGTYKTSGVNLFLLAVQYPDPARAQAAAARFQKDILKGAPERRDRNEGQQGQPLDRPAAPAQPAVRGFQRADSRRGPGHVRAARQIAARRSGKAGEGCRPRRASGRLFLNGGCRERLQADGPARVHQEHVGSRARHDGAAGRSGRGGGAPQP